MLLDDFNDYENWHYAIVKNNEVDGLDQENYFVRRIYLLWKPHLRNVIAEW